MKKIISLFLACVMLVGCFAFALPVSAATSDGFFPGWKTFYELEEKFPASPTTFEAVVQFPAAYATYRVDSETGEVGPGVGGSIIGNFNGFGGSERFGINFGHPSLYWRDEYEYGTNWDDRHFHAVFDEVPATDIYADEPVHISIVRDFDKLLVSCYINGEFVQSLTFDECLANVTSNTYASFDAAKLNRTYNNFEYIVGGDHVSDNRNRIRAIGSNDNDKAIINDIALYSDIRTAEEIRNDYSAIGEDKDGLIAHFDFSGYDDSPKELSDVTGKYVSYRDYCWYKNSKITEDYAYSIAFLGDTQSLVDYNPDNVPKLFDWLIDNKDAKKIGYVVGLGDVTEHSYDSEYQVMFENYARLDGVLPYVPIRGNHDKTSAATGCITYDEAIDKYLSAYEASIPDAQKYDSSSMLNFYVTENIHGVPYLFLCLNFAPVAAEIEWANKVVAANPNYNVIVLTHAYMYMDGTTLDESDDVAANREDRTTDDHLYNGDMIWEDFISKHENICMVLSGHIGYDDVVIATDTGDNGNEVVQVLIDHQHTDNATQKDGGAGIATMFYFMGDGKTVQTETLSTVKAESGVSAYHFCERNHKTITLDLRGTLVDYNDNVVTDVEDMLLVLQELLKPTGDELYDVNADGKISLTDVLRVSKEIVK